MTDYVLVIFILVVLLVAQQIYWSFLVEKLLNKLMSRNYTEYIQSQALSEEIKSSNKQPKKDMEFQLQDEYAVRQAQDMNRLIGVS